MKPHELLDRYAALTPKQRVRFLSSFAAELTVLARNTYGALTIAYGPKLREFNELQHRVTGHLRDLILDRTERFPDEAICEILWHGAHDLKIDRALQRTLDAVSREGANPARGRRRTSNPAAKSRIMCPRPRRSDLSRSRKKNPREFACRNFVRALRDRRGRMGHCA